MLSNLQERAFSYISKNFLIKLIYKYLIRLMNYLIVIESLIFFKLDYRIKIIKKNFLYFFKNLLFQYKNLLFLNRNLNSHNKKP